MQYRSEIAMGYAIYLLDKITLVKSGLSHKQCNSLYNIESIHKESPGLAAFNLALIKGNIRSDKTNWYEF